MTISSQVENAERTIAAEEKKIQTLKGSWWLQRQREKDGKDRRGRKRNSRYIMRAWYGLAAREVGGKFAKWDSGCR